MTTLFGNIFSTNEPRPLLNLGERAADENEMYRRMLDAASEKIRSAIPAKVVSFNAAKQTIVAQPLIREKVIDRTTGSVQWVQLPPLPDVPVQFPQAGNFVLTLPITAGDEVLLVFNDLCIDAWWASGGIQNWNVRRRHDLSDAVAIPGLNSVPNVIPDIATDAAELRSKDGAIKVQVKGDKVSLIAGSNKIELSATEIAFTGTLKFNGFPYLAHTHADPVSGTTGPVIP